MAQYSIKDLESIIGIKAHTIRMWEQRYGVVKPERSSSNIRSYSDEDLKKLLTISQLNKRGIKISRIANMCNEELMTKAMEEKTGLNNENIRIDQLIMSVIDLDERTFNSILNREKKERGFERVMESTVFNLMNKIGHLWMTGTINSALEHFSSHLIRRFILEQKISNVKQKKSKNFILFLPCNEWHELGLLYLDFLVRQAGHRSFYFGQNTPIHSLKKAIENINADYILPSWLTQYQKLKKDQLLEEIINAFPEAKIIVQKNGESQNVLEIERILNFESISEFKSFLTHD